MSNTITVTGTGGIIEGNLGPANVNVNLDRSLMFDGTNDYINCGTDTDHDFTDHFTLACWAKNDNATTAGGDREHLIAKYAGSNDHRLFRLYLHGSTLRFGVGYNSGNNSVEITHSMTGLAEHWNHYAASFDGGVMKLYVNGVLVTNTDNSGTLTAIHSKNTRALNLGAYEDGGHTWTGQMADARIYNAVLTDANIQVLASKINTDSSLGAGTTNLKGYWKLNNETASGGGSGTGFVVDESGTVNQGTLTNFSGTYWDYDAYSVDVYDNSTTTDGTFTITQGKVEGKALSSVDFDGGNDTVNLASSFTMSHDGSSVAVWVKKDNATGNEDVIIGQFSDANQHWMKIDTNGDVIFRDYPNDVHCDTAITDTNWHHIVVTLSGDSNGAIYVDGVAQTLSDNAIVGDPTFDQIGRRGSDTDPFDGKIRDLKVFDYALSAEQAASLYSNTYPQTALSNWKFDEGTGNATNSGTSSANNGTLSNGAAFSNGTLDLDGNLTVEANGTLSAPRGTLECAGTNVKNLGAFTHNSGTVKFNQAGNNTINNDDAANDTVFHNVISSPGGRTRFYNSCTIENALTHTSGTALQLDGGRNITLTMGTATSAGSIDITAGEFFRIYPSASTNTVAAANSLFPCVVTGADWSWSDGAGTINLSGLDFQMNIVTGTNGSDNGTIILTGDCEFDGFTVSSNDTLNLNGQRAKLSGTLTGAGTVACGTNALIETAGLINYDNTGTWSGNCNIISTASANHYLKPSTVATHNITNLFLKNGANPQRWQNDFVQNIIVGGGTQSFGDPPPTTGPIENITIATGAAMNGADRTLTFDGDFTTSGGLLGESCLSLDSSNTEYAEVADHADLDFPFNNNKITLECWFKTSTTDAHQYLFDRRNGQDVFYMYIDHGGNHVRGRIFTSGITSEIRGTSTVNDGKWHHAALVYDGAHSGSTTTAAHKLYIDGKLEAEELASGAIYSGTIPLRFGTRYSNEHFLNGEMDEIRVFAAAKTAAQIREDMFKDVGTSLTHFNTLATSSSTGLVGRWGANEGTGSALSCSNSNLNGVIYDYNGGSPAAYTDAWAGAGTFTYGTSTLNFTKSGTAVFNYLNDEDIYNLTIGTGNTLRLECLDDSGGRVDIFGTLNMTGTKITTGVTSGNSTISFSGTGDRTNVINNPSTALADLYRVSMLQSSDTITMPAVTVKRLICNGAGTTLLSGALAVTESDGLTISAGTLSTGSDHALTVAGALANDGTLTLNGSTVNLGSTSTEAGDVTGAGTFNLDTSTINYHTAGGANFIPSTSANFDTNTSTLNLIGLNGSNRAHNFTFASGNMHNITTSRGAGTDTHTDTLNGNCTITGKLTVGANSKFSSGTRVFTVNGDVELTGELDCDGSNKPMSFGGLKLNSGSTFSATSGTTTITNRYTGESHLWKNDGGTFTHNNGTVKFNDNDHSAVKENTFYNVEVESNLGDYAVSFEAQGGGGNAFTILEDLTITRGDFELVNADDTCDIHGKTIINGSSNSAARFNNDKNQTATITHHGPVEIYTGTYHVEDGGSVKILGGFRNIGGVVD